MNGQQRTPVVHESAPWIVLWTVGGGFGLWLGVWLGGTLGVLAQSGRWRPPPFSVKSAFNAVGHGPASLWPGASRSWITGGIVCVLVLVAAIVGVSVWVIRRQTAGTQGLATRYDVKSMTGKRARERAIALRPSLQGVADIADDEVGILLGDLDPHGPELRGSWEDQTLAVMAPRAGKSTALAAPAVLNGPGPRVLTSNKSDVYALTVAARRTVGTAWVLDPQGIAYTNRAMWWDMIAEARTIEGARRLAGHFIAALADADSRRDFWSTAAGNTLTSLFHAAALARGTVQDVLGWLANTTDRSAADILRDKGMSALGEQLMGTIRGAVETREGIFETARQAVSCLLDPQVAAWVTPSDGMAQFKPAAFVTSRDTLYLLSKDGGGSAAGVIAAAADAVMRAAVVAAERAGGRLDPPLVCVLDEAANICRISDLPDLYSHLGSRGVVIMTILQSYRQGVRVWGEPGMDSLWSAATIKVLGAGLDDADFVEKVSRLIGDHKVQEQSFNQSPGQRSVTVSRQKERILPVEQLRALPKGRALLLVTGTKGALIRLRPWYEEPAAAQLEKARVAETAAITARALKKAVL